MIVISNVMLSSPPVIRIVFPTRSWMSTVGLKVLIIINRYKIEDLESATLLALADLLACRCHI
jgi:hypothetical protein